MRKYLLIAAALLLGSTTIFSQFIREEDRIRDSLHIDSLIKKIPVTKDTARINYLNKLSNTIIYAAYPSKIKADWVLPYIEMAYKEAKQSGYNIGVAYSLINFCQTHVYYSIYNTRNNIDNTATLNKFETHVNELMDIAVKINDPEILGEAYGYKAWLMGPLNNTAKRLDAQINAIKWRKISGNETEECQANLNISYTYLGLGEFENAFDYCKRSLELAKKLVQTRNGNEINDVWLQESYINMSTLYKAAGDYESAMNLIQEGRKFHFTHNSSSTWDMNEQLADLFLETGQYDSSIHYLKPFIKNGKYSKEWPKMADAYFRLNKIDSALKYYDLAIDSLEIRGTLPWAIDGLARSYFGKAQILNLQKSNKEALKYAKKSLAMAQRSKKLYVLNNYELMSKLFHQLGKNDSAYAYLVKHNELKDSLLTRQFLFRLNNYKTEVNEAKKEARIGFLNRDNKIKEQQLKQEASFKKFLLIGLLLLFIASVFIIRTFLLKRKNDKLKNLQLENELRLQQLEIEKRQTEFQKKTTELEMQALRAQMNPHFIFNCLSSINRFILKNEPDAASDYLTRFSRLIRMVLINSQKSLITLEDELDMLTIYLDMERLRFKNNFDYHIVFTNRVDAGAIYIPPLLLQPFCENAIWHGLKHLSDPQSGRDEHGKLDIILSMEDKVLNCSITDNGIGRQKAAEIKSKSAEENKSLGLKITTERLALLNQEKENLTSFEIVDLYAENARPDDSVGRGEAAGTSVKLKIFLSETVEEYAS